MTDTTHKHLLKQHIPRIFNLSAAGSITHTLELTKLVNIWALAKSNATARVEFLRHFGTATLSSES